MCYGCYEEAGKPKPEAEALRLGPLLREVNPFGGCHIVVEDWNLEEEHIDFCINEPRTTSIERELMFQLKALPEDQRYAALAVRDNYHLDEI